MHIPFLPRAEVESVLEQENYADEARGEFLAEQGSSYFYGGAGADASFMAARDWAEREEDFSRSEEGELYFARLEAANFFHTAVTRDMIVTEVHEDMGAWGTTVLPEFDRYFDTQPEGQPTGFEEDIPF